jgi:hypothetical protein
MWFYWNYVIKTILGEEKKGNEKRRERREGKQRNHC